MCSFSEVELNLVMMIKKKKTNNTKHTTPNIIITSTQKYKRYQAEEHLPAIKATEASDFFVVVTM